MIVLLPPSETKRSGGPNGSRLKLDELSFPILTRERERCLEAVSVLAEDEEACVAALKLGPKQRHYVGVNRRMASSPVLPAVDRYTGVLYDALDASSLGERARRALGEGVVIHSALFGLVGALDPIPEYRLSHGSRLPHLPLRRLWSEPVSSALTTRSGLILDARSEGYAALGPAPADRSVFLRVVSEDSGGRRRALNHFNKRAKGKLVRWLAEDGRSLETLDELVSWASSRGLRMERSGVSGRSGDFRGSVPEIALVV